MALGLVQTAQRPQFSARRHAAQFKQGFLRVRFAWVVLTAFVNEGAGERTGEQTWFLLKIDVDSLKGKEDRGDGS